MTDASKTFPNRTEGSVKKHWYKVRGSGTGNRWFGGRLIALQDMHYADFAEDDVSFATHRAEAMLTWGVQSAALLAAIKEYEASKWKVIGAKVGKPAKVNPSLRRRRLLADLIFDCRRASSMRRRISGARFERSGARCLSDGNIFLRYQVIECDHVCRGGEMEMDIGCDLYRDKAILAPFNLR